ncbi:isoprenylcysteine carboxylmethyltransferase family protein [Lebetimonas sp. JH292]|uniref:methyltransferase family protein n=1 Tax=Lebetimonas sp. JH292 TaxID=990068 RepID=UPI000466F584|nr:methyltransferase [Lebetimonas sp. JH292]
MKKRFTYWIVLFLADLGVCFFAPRLIEKNLFLEILGVLFIIYAIMLNSIAGRTLKLYGHKVKTDKFSPPDKFVNVGIFSCMRHPGQFGNMFLMVGVALLSSKIIAVLFAGWLMFLGAMFILFVEEAEAIKKFGKSYCEYIAKTPPFKFSFKCLKMGIEVIRNKPFVKY